jgi:hypothetical protein
MDTRQARFAFSTGMQRTIRSKKFGLSTIIFAGSLRGGSFRAGGRERTQCGFSREREASVFWNRDAVGRHDLRLIAEHFTALRIYNDFEPLHVVRAIRLVIAKGLDAREVFETPSLDIKKRPVYAEVMRVAMHIGDGLAKGDHLVTQGQQEFLEAVGLSVGLSESLRVAQRRAGRV